MAGATGYEFMLARNDEFTDAIVTMTGVDALPTTVWVYNKDLGYSTTYFWKIRAISATSHSEWVTSVFTTTSKPVTKPPPVVVQQASVPSPLISSEPITLVPSNLLWLAVGVGAALTIALLVLIVRTGR